MIENRHWTEALFSLRVEGGTLSFRGRAVRAHRARHRRRARRAAVLHGQRARRPGARVLRHRGARGAALAAPGAPGAGETLYVAPNPAGFLVLSELPDAETLWLMSTGTGIAPFISMLRTETPWQHFRNVVLVHAVRHARELVYREDIAGNDEPPLQVCDGREPRGRPGALRGRIPARVRDGRLEAAAGLPLAPGLPGHAVRQSRHAQGHAAAALVERGMRKHRRRRPATSRGELLVKPRRESCWRWARHCARRGCSTLRLAYDNADTYLHYRANSYLDLHGEGSEELDERIESSSTGIGGRAAAVRAHRGGSGEAGRRQAFARGPRLGVRFSRGAGAAKPARRRRADGAAARPPDAREQVAAHGEALRRGQPQVRARVPARQRGQAPQAPRQAREEEARGLGGEPVAGAARESAAARARAALRRDARPRPQARAGGAPRHDPQARGAEAPARLGRRLGTRPRSGARRASERRPRSIWRCCSSIDARSPPSSAAAPRRTCGATPRTSAFSRAAAPVRTKDC